MSGVRVWLAIAVVLLGTSSLLSRPAAAWPDDPLLNVALCDTVSDQQNPVSVTDGAGGAIVAWADRRSGSYGDIYVQRIAADGQVLWLRNGVALCTAAYAQNYPAIVSDGAGGAIVAWEDERNTGDIYAQRISASGAVQWTANGVALCAAAGMQQTPAIASDGAGGAIVAWEDVRGPHRDIYVQRVSPAGAVQWTANGVAVCTFAGDQYYPAVAPDDSGGVYVVWEDPRNASIDLYAQRVSPAGTPLWTANGVALCLAAGVQTDLKLVADGVGGAIAAWSDARSGSNNIFAGRLSRSGLGPWTADGESLCTAPGDQQRPALAPDGAGGAIVAWQDWRGVNFDIYARRVMANGFALWTDNGVPLCTATGGQGRVRVITDGTGGAIVGWEDSRGTSMDIYAQRVSSLGDVLWGTDGVSICGAAENQWDCTMASDGAGGALVAWQDFRNDLVEPGSDIYAQRVWADGTTPVLVSLADARVDGDFVVLEWFAGDGFHGDATVHRSAGGDGWARIGTISADGTGRMRYTDSVAGLSGRVGYRLGVSEGGVESFLGEAWVDLPRPGFALEGARPNPATGGALTVRFTLADAAPARLELVDVSGRRVLAREVGVHGAGTHTLTLDEGPGLAPGLYLLRLSQGTSSRVTRVAVVN